MFAEMAKTDLARLRAEGYEPTDEDVVRLNDLAVLIQHGKDTTAANHPRFAFAGNVVLHEPTIGALEWWWTYGFDAFWLSSWKLRTHYFMLAHARRLDILAHLKRQVDVRRAVKTWLRGVGATDDELFRALMYVKHGVENAAATEGEKPEPADPDHELDVLDALLAETAGKSGIAPSEIRTLTQLQSDAVLRAACRAGELPTPSTARLYRKYKAVVREIEARGKKADKEVAGDGEQV
jgi:hypothetical protein